MNEYERKEITDEIKEKTNKRIFGRNHSFFVTKYLS